jgi:hypothetical protein
MEMSLSSLLFIVFDLMGMFLENSSKYFKSKARSTFGETGSLEFPSRLRPVPECVSCDKEEWERLNGGGRVHIPQSCRIIKRQNEDNARERSDGGRLSLTSLFFLLQLI